MLYLRMKSTQGGRPIRRINQSRRSNGMLKFKEKKKLTLRKIYSECPLQKIFNYNVLLIKIFNRRVDKKDSHY